MHVCFRLQRGADLREALLAMAREKGLLAAVPLACAGCVSRWRVRGADGKTIYSGEERAEIVSLTGTLSAEGCHLHISFAREDLSVFGGHLVGGCIINTTAEIVLEMIDDVVFSRVFDPETGYEELQSKESPRE